jgi:hypothetical protein
VTDAYWLSFVDTEKSAPYEEQVSGGGGFLGVSIVLAEDPLEAVTVAWEKGVNPGGEVGILGPIPSWAVKESDLYRLLTADEADAVEWLDPPEGVELCQRCGSSSHTSCPVAPWETQ